MAPLSIPVASRLPSSLRMAPTNAAVTRVLSRLSRPSLLSLALDWLDEGNQALTAPYLKRPRRNGGGGGDDSDGSDATSADEDDFYPPAPSLAALQDHYAGLQARKGSKREVLDRILEGDWRHGLSMYQLAMADLQHLYDHPTSQRWTAFQIVPLTARVPPGADGRDDDTAAEAVVDRASLVVPRFHPSSFLRNLQAQILPDIKVHYNFDRHKHLPLLLLRIFILDSPYNTSLAVASAGLAPPAATAAEASRTVYVAFPDASPFVYLSSAQTAAAPAGEQAPGGGGPSSAPASAAAAHASSSSRTDARSLRSLVVEAIPKALSRPRERYALKPTNMATRNLAVLLQRRGAGRTNTAGGGWSIYADETRIESPLDTRLPTVAGGRAHTDGPAPLAQPVGTKRAASPEAAREARLAKRRKQVAAARFGLSAQMGDGCGVERVDIVMQDPFPGASERLPGAEAEDSEEPADEDGAAPAPPAPAGRRRPRGARQSQIAAVLAREEEDEEAERAPVQGRAAGGAAGVDDNAGDDAEGAGASTWRPRVAFTFHGPHVFAGIRQLVEAGIIDGEKMPGWLTGEEGVTVGAVRDGRIRGHKGSGVP